MTTIKSALLCLACFSLSSCAGARTAGERIADMPHWMGGLPADAPPRRGTPEYDEMMTKRAQDAARPKTEQQAAKVARPPLIARMRPHLTQVTLSIARL